MSAKPYNAVEAKRELAVKLYNGGWQRNEISDALHIGRQQIQNLIVEKGDRQAHAEGVQRLQQERLANVKEIAKTFGFSQKEAKAYAKQTQLLGILARYDPEVADQINWKQIRGYAG